MHTPFCPPTMGRAHTVFLLLIGQPCPRFSILLICLKKIFRCTGFLFCSFVFCLNSLCCYYFFVLCLFYFMYICVHVYTYVCTYIILIYPIPDLCFLNLTKPMFFNSGGFMVIPDHCSSSLFPPYPLNALIVTFWTSF